MKYPFSVLLPAAFAAGAIVAWWGFPPSSAASASGSPGAGPGPAVLTQSAHSAGAVKSTLISSWEAIQSGGLQGMGRRLALATLVGRATSRELPRLLELTKKDAYARELILHHWVELDPQAAGNWLAPRMQDFDFFTAGETADVNFVFGAWAQKDPAAAGAKLKAASGPMLYGMFHQGVLEQVLSADMDAGIRFAASMDESANFSSGGGRNMEWVTRDPAKAARLLATLPADSFRDTGLLKTMAVLAKTDVAAAVALQQKFPDLATSNPFGNFSGSDTSRADFYQIWAKSDLAGMTAFLNDQAGGETRTAMKEAIAKNLGETDPNTALAWAADHLTGEGRNSAVEKILTKLSKDDPAAALRYLDSLPEGTALAKAVETFAMAGKDGGHAALLARAGELPDGPARKQLTGKAYGAWFAKEPEVLLKTLAKQPADSLPEGLWRDFANRTNSMDDGLKHLAHIPASGSAEYVKSVFDRHSGWNANVADLTKCINLLTTPAQRLAALESVSSRSSWTNPSGLVEYARSLTSAAERQMVADQITKNNHSLTASEKERLLAPLKSVPPP